jgi:hypothetical protein
LQIITLSYLVKFSPFYAYPAQGDGAQGKSNELGLIVLDWMYSEAEKAGVPLKPLDDDYKPSAETKAVYNYYLQARAAYEQNPTQTSLEAREKSYNVLKERYIHDERAFWEMGNERNVYPQE